ncbi:MAG: hypothetical protein IJU23_02100 [Proteobacteria bacterium]|nr:hypothetical protein [Pseudomonadota bacterium]
MTPVGIMILIHPAIILLMIGSSLIMAGVSWLLMFRKFPWRIGIICCIVVFAVTSLIYALFVGFIYESPAVSIDIVNGLR